MIVDDSFFAEVNMSPEKKKRKLEELYSNHDFSKLKVDECELIELNRVIRNNGCPEIKFLIREGNSNIATHADMMKILKTRPAIGNSYNFADIDKKTGYEG